MTHGQRGAPETLLKEMPSEDRILQVETAMTYIAIQEALDGKVIDWMEKVTDEQYEAK